MNETTNKSSEKTVANIVDAAAAIDAATVPDKEEMNLARDLNMAQNYK
jgi:hypothetical protein